MTRSIQLPIAKQPLITNEISFFRVGIAIFAIGLTLLSFIIPFTVYEINKPLFNKVHSFCAGGLIGLGFVSSIVESVLILKIDIKQVLILSSSSFIIMLILENVFQQPKKYKKLSMIEDSNLEYEDDIEMLQNNDESNNDNDFDSLTSKSKDVTTSNEDIDIDNDFIDDEKELHERKLSKIFPLSLMFIVIAGFSFLHGITISSVQHETYSVIIRYLSQKVLVTLSIASSLAELDVSHLLLKLSLFIYLIAGPIGIVLGGFVFSEGLSYENSILAFLRKYNFIMTGYGSAIISGLYIYISVLYMIPVYLDVSLKIITNNSNENNKYINLILLLVGFLVSISVGLAV